MTEALFSLKSLLCCIYQLSYGVMSLHTKKERNYFIKLLHVFLIKLLIKLKCQGNNC